MNHIINVQLTSYQQYSLQITFLKRLFIDYIYVFTCSPCISVSEKHDERFHDNITNDGTFEIPLREQAFGKSLRL